MNATTFLEEIASAPNCAERDAFAKLALGNERAHEIDSGPVHFTASGIVVDASGTLIALHFHRKVGAWLQFGGHLEPHETSFLEAARRESREESGLEQLHVLGRGPFRLHAHALNSNFSRCSEHWDVQYLFQSPLTPRNMRDRLVTTDESTDVRWFALDDLPAGLAPDLYPALGQVASMAPRGDSSRK